MTKISQDEWREMYAVFNPTVRVEFEDRDLFVARPGAVLDSIADDLRLGLEQDGKWVVCGAMGSGKNSELVELAHRLYDTHAVIGLDLPRSVARIDRIQPAEVLYLIGLAAIRAARDLWDHEVAEKTQEALHPAPEHWLLPRARAQTSRTVNARSLVTHGAPRGQFAGGAVVSSPRR